MKSLSTLTKLVVFLIALVAALIYVLILRTENQVYIDYSILLTKFLLYVMAILALVVWIKDIFSSKKSLIYTLVSLGVFLFIVLIAYLSASNEPYKLGDKVFSASVSKWADTGLYTFYILFGISVLLLVVSALFGGFNFGSLAKKAYVTEEASYEDEDYADEGDE